jgi:hypothetical protein
MKIIFKSIYPYLILALFAIIGFWQVSFFTSSLRWDFIDVVLPFRYHFSECIQSNNFPFWNPFQQTGTPFFSDLQAPSYYPELLFISLAGGYGVYILHILFVLYISIAAIGMYRLSFYFNRSPSASFIAGLAYSFSGYMVGHGQHLFLIIGAAWIPYVVLYYIKLNRERKPANAVKAGVFFFLMITGSYQALSIALIYLVVILFIYEILLTLVQKQIKRFMEIIKVNALLFIIVLLFCSPLIVSTLDVYHSVGRLGEGVSLAGTLEYGQSLKSLLSFFTPFATLKDPGFFGGVDISFINHFIGIIPLIFFTAALSRKRSVPEYIILGFGLIIMAMSFSFLPVREFMFKHIPFMNLFLYAAYIRIFGLFAFILWAANYFAFFEGNIGAEKYKIVAVGTACLGVLLFLMIKSGLRVSINDLKPLFNSNSFDSLLKSMTFHQHVLLQTLIQFAIVSLFTLVIIYYKKLKSPVLLIMILFVTEIFIATQLNMGSTVVDSNFKPYRMQKDLSLCPDKFPIPINDKIIFNDQQHAFFKPFWRNTYIFTKQISFDSFSSFKLNSYSKLEDDYPNLKNAALNNHLFYFSDKIFSLNQLSDREIHLETDSRNLYLSDEDFSLLSKKTIAGDPLDKIIILEFSPNRVSVQTTTLNDQFLTMLQTNYKGWKAYIDGRLVPVYTSNFNYRTIFLPKGNHEVRYEYRNNSVLVLYVISNSFFILCLLFLLGYWLEKKNLNRRIALALPMVLVIILILLLIKTAAYKDPHLSAQQAVLNHWSKKSPVLYREKGFDRGQLAQDSIAMENLEEHCFMVDSTIEFLPIAEIVNEHEKLNNTTMVVNTHIFPNSYSKAFIVSEIISENRSTEWHAVKIEKQIENLNQWNDVVYCRNFYRLKEKDIIKVYLWNPEKSLFEIGNISLAFYD